jgi:hypothetical protein
MEFVGDTELAACSGTNHFCVTKQTLPWFLEQRGNDDGSTEFRVFK